MALVYPLTLPTTPGWVDAQITLTDAAAVSNSPFSGYEQVQQWAAAGWALGLRLPPMPRAQAAPWIAFLAAARGRGNQFYLPVPTRFATPLGVATGTPQVKGSHSAGATSLSVRGLTPSTTGIYNAGDFFELRKNLLTNPESFDNAAWAKVDSGAPGIPTVSADAEADPDGTSLADQITFPVTAGGQTSSIEQEATAAVAAIPLQDLAFGLWMKNSGDVPNQQIQTGSGATSVPQTLGAAWAWFLISHTAGAAAATLFARLRQSASRPAFTCAAWGAALDSPQNGRLHQLTADADTDASGFSTLEIWPPLREDPGDFARLITASPQGRFRLASNERGWFATTPGHVEIAFNAVEALS